MNTNFLRKIAKGFLRLEKAPKVEYLPDFAYLKDRDKFMI